jgi:hypothetical protein
MRRLPEDKREKFKDLLGGMLLVPLFNAVILVLVIVAAYFRSPYFSLSATLFSGETIVVLFCLAFIQVLYVVPLLIYFSIKRRNQVVNGILISFMMMFSIGSSNCFIVLAGGPGLLATILAVYAIGILAVLAMFIVNQ